MKKPLLYLIGYREADINHIKIGIAVDPARRLRQLQTGNAHRLAVLRLIDSPVNAKRMERALHRQFKEYRTSGEWFALSDCELISLEGVIDYVLPMLHVINLERAQNAAANLDRKITELSLADK